MNAIQRKESLHSQLKLSLRPNVLFNAVWSDYTNAVGMAEYYKADYRYCSGIIIPGEEDFIDEDLSTNVSYLIKKLTGDIVFGDADVDVDEIINDDNVEDFHEVQSELMKDFSHDLLVIARHYHISLCVNRAKKIYINMPLKAVW